MMSDVVGLSIPGWSVRAELARVAGVLEVSIFTAHAAFSASHFPRHWA